MKHLLTLTLSLAAAANPLAALADQCDNLRNNQQAYRDCVNDWYGRSNRGSAPSPWWKNYDPNEGSSGNSGSLIQPREEWQRQQREESQRREQERQQQSRQQSLRTQGLNESVEYFVQGQQHYAAGRVEAAADNFRKALALARYHKHDPQSQATIALGLGRAALDLRRYDEAQALFFEVLGVPTRRYESENDEAVYTLLGRTLMGAKRYDAAEVLYKKLAEIIERKVILDAKTAGPGFDAWAGAMDNLATAIEQLGRHAEAEPYRKRVYDATLKTVTSQHQSALNKLNANLEAQGKPSMGQRGAAEYDAIYAMNEQLLLKRYTQALIASDNAMQLAERHSNPGLYALAQEKKAEALIKLNRHAEAESILKKSLESREQHVELKPKLVDYGSREIGLRGNLSGLANLYVAQKQYAQAEPYLQRIVELQEKTRAPVI
jgi:tetratricopeptide (TPR) repeat protein